MTVTMTSQYCFKIVLPLSTAVLASIGLFYAVGRWNEYLPGVLYINDRNKRVLQVVLRTMLDEGTSGVPYESASGDILTPETTKMATVIVTLLPILLVYPFLQKYFMQGVMLGSVKG